MKIKRTFLNIILPIIAGILVVAGVIYAWTEPFEEPPTPNILAPLNTSSGAQHKTGNLTIGGNLGIGTDKPDERLHIYDGIAMADDFCLNSDPTKCIDGPITLSAHCIQREVDGLLSSKITCSVVSLPGFCDKKICACPDGYDKFLIKVLLNDELLSEERIFYYRCEPQ